MPKISEIDLGSYLLSGFILIGFIATAFVFVRLTIIGLNYVKVNFSNEKKIADNQDKDIDSKNKGFLKVFNVHF